MHLTIINRLTDRNKIVVLVESTQEGYHVFFFPLTQYTADYKKQAHDVMVLRSKKRLCCILLNPEGEILFLLALLSTWRSEVKGHIQIGSYRAGRDSAIF